MDGSSTGPLRHGGRLGRSLYIEQINHRAQPEDNYCLKMTENQDNDKEDKYKYDHEDCKKNPKRHKMRAEK